MAAMPLTSIRDGATNRFKIQAPDLAVDLCLFSGQVFRWTRVGPSEWIGVDGENWYHVISRSEGAFEVVSNAREGAFRSLFRLDLDLGVLRAELLSRGPEIGPLFDRLPGLRLMRPTCAHEMLFCFLCTPNNNLARITSMIGRLGAYGEPLAEVAGLSLTRFPTVERIASLGEAELRALGFGYRGRSIPIAARQILNKGEGWLSGLREAPFDEARAQLITLNGVGPKLADCIALYGLQKLEATPFDTHLWQAATRVYFPQWKQSALTETRYREASQFLRGRFGAFAGFAHLYLYLCDMRFGDGFRSP